MQKKKHQNPRRNKKKFPKLGVWPFLNPSYLNNSKNQVMKLVPFYVDFFMGNTKKKPIKIAQEIEILHSIRKNHLLAPPQKKRVGLDPSKSIPTFTQNHLSMSQNIKRIGSPEVIVRKPACLQTPPTTTASYHNTTANFCRPIKTDTASEKSFKIFT